MKDTLKPRRPTWRDTQDAKLFAKGPFIMQIGSRKLRFRFEESYQAARELLSKRRFVGIADMIEAAKSVPNGYN